MAQGQQYLPNTIEVPPGTEPGLARQLEAIQQNFDSLLNNTEGIIQIAVTELTGDVVAEGPGAAAATISDEAVTTAKIADEAVTAAKIEDGVVSNAKLADMAQARIKGRAAAAGTGAPTDLTPDEVSTILDSATDPFVRTSAGASANTYWEPLTDGDDTETELIFADGRVIMVEVPL